MGALHQTDIFRRLVETIMLAVDIADRSDEFFGGGIIERSDSDEIERAVLWPMFAATCRADATRFAEAIMQIGYRVEYRAAISPPQGFRNGNCQA